MHAVDVGKQTLRRLAILCVLFPYKYEISMEAKKDRARFPCNEAGIERRCGRIFQCDQKTCGLAEVHVAKILIFNSLMLL